MSTQQPRHKFVSEDVQLVDLRLLRINAIQSPDLINWPHVSALAESIRSTGRLLHIPIGRSLHDQPGCVEIASGVHRFLAFQQLNKAYPNCGFHVMPVKVMALSDIDFYRAMWVGNNQRHMSPLERGMWLVSMLEKGGLRQVDLESIAEIRQQSISIYVRVARAPRWLRMAIHEGLIPSKYVGDFQCMCEDDGDALYAQLAGMPEDERGALVAATRQNLWRKRCDARPRRQKSPPVIVRCPWCGRMPAALRLDVAGARYVCCECDQPLRVRLTAIQSVNDDHVDTDADTQPCQNPESRL
jgi:hypothetical protein